MCRKLAVIGVYRYGTDAARPRHPLRRGGRRCRPGYVRRPCRERSLIRSVVGLPAANCRGPASAGIPAARARRGSGHRGRSGVLVEVWANVCGSTQRTDRRWPLANSFRRASSAWRHAPPAGRPARPTPSAQLPIHHGQVLPAGRLRRHSERLCSSIVGRRRNRRNWASSTPRSLAAMIVLGIDQQRGLIEDHGLGLGAATTPPFFLGQRHVQFAQGVQGHRAGHFAARRHGKLLLGEREVAPHAPSWASCSPRRPSARAWRGPR